MPNPTLAEFSVDITRAAFLRAKSFRITRAVGLSIYRSVMLDEHDDWHKPIYEALGLHPHREVLREQRDDPAMIFGKAEHIIYALAESEEGLEDSALRIKRHLKGDGQVA